MRKSAAAQKKNADKQSSLKKKSTPAVISKNKKTAKSRNHQKGKVVYAMSPVTYATLLRVDDVWNYNVIHTMESNWAFDGIPEMKNRAHEVLYTAEMKTGQDKNKIMPSTPCWKVTAHVDLLDTSRVMNSPVTLFNNITELEARFWLKLFTEQARRTTKFQKLYYGITDDDEQLPSITDVSRLFMASGKDKFVRHSKMLDIISPKKRTFPRLMMTDQIFAMEEYDPRPPEERGDVLEDDDQDMMRDIDWDLMARGLKPEVAATIKNNLINASEVSQIIAWYFPKNEDYFLHAPHAKKNKTQKFRPAQEKTNLFRLFCLNGGDMICFYETESCEEAVQIGMNAQDAIITPALQAVAAHKALEGSYAYHFRNYARGVKNFDSFAKNIDRRNKLHGLN